MTFAARPLRETAPGVQLTNRSWSWTSISPANAYAGVRYQADGTEDKVEGETLSWTNLGDWLLRGSASNYWIRCEYSGDAPVGSATYSWLQLSSDRSWYLAETTNGFASQTTQLTIQIATDAGGSNVIASCTIDLDVVVEI